MSETRKRRRHRGVRIALISFCVLLVTATGVAYYLGQRLVAPIDRIEGVFSGLEDRPPKPSKGPGADAVNILLLGTDRRSAVPTTGSDARAAAWVPGAQRADAMLVLHISADRDEASVISLPRDAWVELPHRGFDKLNAAYSYGGPSLAVEAIEKLTQLRIDHLAVIDWAGLRELTDELGGVTVTVPETVHDSARGVTWTAGTHHLGGQEALNYVGQRYGLPGGDLDRARRQQNFLRTVMGEALGRLSDAGTWDVYELLRVMTSNISVDEEWSTKDMAKLAWSLRDIDESNVAFLTVPVAGLGWEGPQSVVYLDHGAGRQLWNAVREDRMSGWLREHPAAALLDSVR